jgi:hypothetical protein
VTTIPTEVTTGEVARILDITERRVATLKAEGRIPGTPSGRIDLPGLLSALYRENVDHRRRSASTGSTRKIPGPLSWAERHPGDAMANVALNTMAMLTPQAVKRAAMEAGISVADAERLHQVMQTEAATLRTNAAEFCGILRDPDGPEPMARVNDTAEEQYQ